MAKSNKNQNGNSQVQSIIITAITLFALAGAILGFSVGALTHHSASNNKTANNNKTTNTNKTAKSTPTTVETPPTPTATVPTTALPLGSPTFADGIPLAGTYKHTFTIQAMLQNGQAATASGITCRIWLVKSQPAYSKGGPEQTAFLNITAISQSLPDEISGGLTVDPTTPLTQPCVNGMAKWNVSLSPTLPKGTYYIVGLTDWNGVHFNWAWSGGQIVP